MPPPPIPKPSDGNVNRGPTFLATLWATTAITSTFVLARIFVRMKIIKYVGWDDYLIMISMVLGIVGVSLDTVAVYHGLGRHEFYLDLDQITQATKFNFIAIPWNLMSSATAKVSVCFFLLHVNQNKKAAYVLYTMSVIIILFAAATIAVLFGQCNPSKALWTLSLREDHCLNPGVNAAVGLAQSVFFAIADAAFALFPLTFLWKLRITRRTKLALGFVLSLGLLAAAFGVVRCVNLQEIASRQDILFSTIDLGVWSFLEQNITIIAACIPPFYAVFRAVLGNRSSAGTPAHPSHKYRNESKASGAGTRSYNGAVGSGIRRGIANEGFEFSGMAPQNKKPTGTADPLAWEDSTPGSSHNNSFAHSNTFGKDDVEDRGGMVLSGPGIRGSEDSSEDILPKQGQVRRGNERVTSGSHGYKASDQRIVKTTEITITREDRKEGSRQERVGSKDIF